MHRFFFILSTLSFILSSCNTFTAVEPTPTVMPSPTTEATKTPTPHPTPTSIPTLAPLFVSGGIESLVTSEGFTISVPFPLIYQANKNIILVADEEKTFNVSFASNKYDGSQPLIEVINSYLTSLENRGWQFTKGQITDIQVDGATGIAIDLTGIASNVAFVGQAVAVTPNSGFLLFSMAISQIDDDQNNWKTKGQSAFTGLLERIKFTDANTTCPISTDQTYGFTQGNPILIGGDDFNGPSREKAYLDHLAGPNGETISYEREGSLPTDTTILDEYKITGAGISMTLYLDEYNYISPQAPVGFTCNGAFPFSAPE